MLLKLDRLDEAARHARLGEKSNPGGTHLLLARIALARKDYRGAEAEAKISAGDRYSHIPALVLLAQVAAQQDRAPEAYALIQQVAAEAQERKLGPVEALEFVRGDALARMQRYDEAIAAFQREISIFPKDRQAYASLYLVYLLTNRPREAHAALEAMASANPNRRALLFAALTAETVGDRVAAQEWRQRAQHTR